MEAKVIEPKDFTPLNLVEWSNKNNDDSVIKMETKNVEGKDIIIIKAGNPYKMKLPDKWQYRHDGGFKNTGKDDHYIKVKKNPPSKVEDSLDFIYALECEDIPVKIDAHGTILIDKNFDNLNWQRIVQSSDYKVQPGVDGRMVVTLPNGKEMPVLDDDGMTAAATTMSDTYNADGQNSDSVTARGDEMSKNSMMENFRTTIDTYFSRFGSNYEPKELMEYARSLNLSPVDMLRYTANVDETGQAYVTDDSGKKIVDPKLAEAVMVTKSIAEGMASRDSSSANHNFGAGAFDHDEFLTTVEVITTTATKATLRTAILEHFENRTEGREATAGGLVNAGMDSELTEAIVGAMEDGNMTTAEAVEMVEELENAGALEGAHRESADNQELNPQQELKQLWDDYGNYQVDAREGVIFVLQKDVKEDNSVEYTPISDPLIIERVCKAYAFFEECRKRDITDIMEQIAYFASIRNTQVMTNMIIDFQNEKIAENENVNVIKPNSNTDNKN